MSAQLNKEELQFLTLFNRNPDGERLKLILKKKLEAADLDCRTKEEVHVYRAQGAALMLRELLNDIERAEDKLRSATVRPIAQTERF